MTWTNTLKPTTSGWTNLNPGGRTQYDQADITYDDSRIFYNGGDPSFWTMVPKATGGGSNTITVGMATGLLMPLTYSRSYEVSGDSWTKVPKPTN